VSSRLNRSWQKIRANCEFALHIVVRIAIGKYESQSVPNRLSVCSVCSTR